MQRRIIFGSFLAVVVVIALFVWLHAADTPNQPGQGAMAGPPLVNQAALNALPHKSASTADTSHLAVGLLPPTNMWLSGMVLQKIPEPVFPMPLSFLAKETGFEIGLPTISSGAAIISGQHTPGLVAALAGAEHFVVSRYDKLSATLQYSDTSHRSLGQLTLAEGSPYVFYRANQDSTIQLSGIDPGQIRSHRANYFRYGLLGHDYVVAGSHGVTITPNGGTVTIQVQKGSLVTFYTLKNANTSDTLRALAGNELTGVRVSYHQTGKNSVTDLTYQTRGAQPTLFAALPYQTLSGKTGSVVTTYDSMYGTMPVVRGTDFSFSVPLITPSNSLNLAHIPAAQKNVLKAKLSADIASTKIDSTDSYYAGKQLARAANLLAIAEQLKLPAEANQLKTILNNAFAQRLSPQYWYYDTTLKGIAAQTQSFGSEDFNDHHFHYGYFIYAASILGAYEPQFVTSYLNQVNLLVADIASYQPGSVFPVRRTYDPYAGHSWAAGLAPFADGNNQESSSEAIQAWNGVALWGQLTHNQTLAQSGQWMLANEAHAAQSIWRSVNTKAAGTGSYTSPLVDINFGGKRVYSTFFQADPGAKLGIQLIPMNPAFTSFAADGSNITRLANASIQADNYNVPLGDYDLMYLSLISPQKAASLAITQTTIDDGDSETYLNAFIFARLNP